MAENSYKFNNYNRNYDLGLHDSVPMLDVVFKLSLI